MRILVTGASGQLGSYLLRELASQGKHEVVAWSGMKSGERFGYKLQPVDLSKRSDVHAAFEEAWPDALIHAAAMSSVAECNRDRLKAAMVNVNGTLLLSELADDPRVRFVFVSTDLVFDGEKAPYGEVDFPSTPLIYGTTKKIAERGLIAHPNLAIARLSLLYGPSLNGRPNFFDQQVAALRSRQPLPLFVDEWRTPLDYPTAARALIELVESDYTGILHIGGPERLSRYEMGLKLAKVLDADPSVFVPTERAAVTSPEPRPRDVSLDSSKWRALTKLQVPAYEEALREMLGERGQ